MGLGTFKLTFKGAEVDKYSRSRIQVLTGLVLVGRCCARHVRVLLRGEVVVRRLRINNYNIQAT